MSSNFKYQGQNSPQIQSQCPAVAGPKSLQQTTTKEDYKSIATKLRVFLDWIARDWMVNRILVASELLCILNRLYTNNNYNENQSRRNNLSNNKDDIRHWDIHLSLCAGNLRIMNSSMWINILRCYLIHWHVKIFSSYSLPTYNYKK